MQILSGKCLCGGIEYQITGDIGPILNCHCSLCRRWHGAAFRTRSTINADQFKWLKGENLLSGYFSSPTTERTFCSICGSNLISWYTDQPDKIGIPLGGLDQAPNNRLEGHVYVGSKSPWFAITDELPQFDTVPKSWIKTNLADE